MNLEERELPDFIEDADVIRYAAVQSDDFIQNPRDYVTIQSGSHCGNWGAKSLYLKNNSTDKRIGVTIEIRWVYQNKPMVESRLYNLYVNQTIELGCPIPGPTAQRFDFSIVGAWFA